MEGEAVKMKRFDKAFKIQAVKMVTEEGQKTSEVARSLGIHANVLYNWKRKYSQDGDKAFIGKGHLSEIVVLRRKLRGAEIEIEILKKAVGIFSKTTENGSSS
ncbi:MAG: transposase [Candidatus Omnitrophica bacterium]|nr:transposase [Candidatus Omnitrophota bacterium]MCG2707931.1 transposase [Candidatus Omnitrophota bacterium]